MVANGALREESQCSTTLLFRTQENWQWAWHPHEQFSKAWQLGSEHGHTLRYPKEPSLAIIAESLAGCFCRFRERRHSQLLIFKSWCCEREGLCCGRRDSLTYSVCFVAGRLRWLFFPCVWTYLLFCLVEGQWNTIWKTWITHTVGGGSHYKCGRLFVFLFSRKSDGRPTPVITIYGFASAPLAAKEVWSR